eukprot:7389308-Prymnesium_polylepis.1
MPQRRVEQPLLCAQTLTSRERVLVCSRCGSAAASFDVQLALCTGRVRRKRLMLSAATGASADDATCWCPAGCGEAWCSDDCRAADAKSHALLCPGSMRSDGEPMAAFTSYALRAGETLLLGAQAIAQAVARALARNSLPDGTVDGCDGANDGDEAAADAAAAAAAAAEARTLCEACGSLGCDGSEGAGAGAEAAPLPLSAGAQEQAAEAWQLLRAALSLRLSRRAVRAVRVATSATLCQPLPCHARWRARAAPHDVARLTSARRHATAPRHRAAPPRRVHRIVPPRRA